MKKTCNKCNSEKNTSEFYVNNRNKDKLEGTCKDCIKEKNKQNRDKQREAQRKWREKNPDYMKNYGKTEKRKD
jgi:predicted sulfurtransferase